MFKSCPTCHTVYATDEDLYCRCCGSKRIVTNHCKSCDHACELNDLYCPVCGSETEIYDIIAR